MNKTYIFLLITAIVVILACFFFVNSSICLDKGGSRIYFEKTYYLSHLSEFYNKSGTSVIIPEEQIMAKFSESANCYDRGAYFIRENGKLREVTKEKSNNFVNNYNSNSLLVQIRAFGPAGIFDVSSNKFICNDYSYNRAEDSECMNITSS
jgi:hypothetical protein